MKIHSQSPSWLQSSKRSIKVDIIIKMNKLQVVQFEGLMPSVFLGMYFADQGAQVTLLARDDPSTTSIPININILNRNKKCVSVNLKNKEHLELVKKMIGQADIVIDPFRPGVLERLKLGPADLHKINSRIILLRVSGYGQRGPLALRPGHDLNYISISGIVPLLNKPGQHQFPTNFMADFVSASLGITGTLAALAEREKTGLGKVVDCSLAHGAIYLAQHLLNSQPPKPLTVREIKHGDQSYIYSSKDNHELSLEDLLKLLNGQKYYRGKDDLQISLVNGIEPLDGCNVVNPFSNIQLSNKICSKGQHDAQILGSLRAKL